VAKIEGSDQALRDEWVVYTTHWTTSASARRWTAMRSTAARSTTPRDGWAAGAGRAFQRATPKPRRSILFLFVTAEEQGLLGSRALREEPLYPLAKTLAVLNLDVLNVHGRTRDLTIVGLGLSTLDDVIGRAAAAQGAS